MKDNLSIELSMGLPAVLCCNNGAALVGGWYILHVAVGTEEKLPVQLIYDVNRTDR